MELMASHARNQSALIAGYTGGIGKALTYAISKAGDYQNIYKIGRSPDASMPICYDDSSSIEQAAKAIAKNSSDLRLMIVATGLLHDGPKMPEKSLRQIDAIWMAENFKVNAIGPALLAKYFLPIMPRKGRIVFAVLSARIGSISDNLTGGWYSYRASKAALNMIIKNLAIEAARNNPEAIIVALHPGTVETKLSAPFSGGGQEGGRFTADESARRLLNVIGGLTAADSGQIFDYNGVLIAP